MPGQGCVGGAGGQHQGVRGFALGDEGSWVLGSTALARYMPDLLWQLGERHVAQDMAVGW